MKIELELGVDMERKYKAVRSHWRSDGLLHLDDEAMLLCLIEMEYRRVHPIDPRVAAADVVRGGA